MNTVQNEEYFNIRYQVKPFIFWIWFSVLLISLGGIISLFKKKFMKNKIISIFLLFFFYIIFCNFL